MKRADYFRGTPEERFWHSVKKSEGCWKWTGLIEGGRGSAYGRFSVHSKYIMAHRYSWQLHFGDIPIGMKICHKCDNMLCVRPDHLFMGTQQDNVNDMLAKGRKRPACGSANGSVTCPESRPRGEKHARAKLTADDVREIRRLAGKMAARKIGEMFGIKQAQVIKIYKRQAWAHVV